MYFVDVFIIALQLFTHAEDVFTALPSGIYSNPKRPQELSTPKQAAIASNAYHYPPKTDSWNRKSTVHPRKHRAVGLPIDACIRHNISSHS